MPNGNDLTTRFNLVYIYMYVLVYIITLITSFKFTWVKLTKEKKT